MDHRQRCNYDVAVAPRISLRSGSSAGEGGNGRHARKVVVALGDDLIQPASLEWSGVCTSGGEESRDNSSDGLETRHVVSLIIFVMNVG